MPALYQHCGGPHIDQSLACAEDVIRRADSYAGKLFGLRSVGRQQIGEGYHILPHGLNRLAASPELREKLSARVRERTVLTPHKGAMARLLRAFQLPESEDSADNACRLADRTGALVVAKGPHSVIASPDGSSSRNLSGCSALATAGSGDVLSGMIAALAASHPVRSGQLSLRQAVAAAVYLHGLTGELCAPPPHSGRGVTADDLAGRIPEVLRNVSPFA